MLNLTSDSKCRPPKIFDEIEHSNPIFTISIRLGVEYLTAVFNNAGNNSSERNQHQRIEWLSRLHHSYGKSRQGNVPATDPRVPHQPRDASIELPSASTLRNRSRISKVKQILQNS